MEKLDDLYEIKMYAVESLRKLPFNHKPHFITAVETFKPGSTPRWGDVSTVFNRCGSFIDEVADINSKIPDADELKAIFKAQTGQDKLSLQADYGTAVTLCEDFMDSVIKNQSSSGIVYSMTKPRQNTSLVSEAHRSAIHDKLVLIRAAFT